MQNDAAPGDARPAPPRPARSPHHARWLLAVVVAGLGAALGTTLAPGPNPPDTTTASAATVVPPAGALALQNAFVHALQAATPSVVEISTTTGLGSGVVYDAKGDVVTNAHVVGTSTSFTVRLSNGRRVSGTLVGTYPADDLAVIRLASATGVRPATFANSSRLQVGDLTLAIGSPLGLSGSVTDGIVSSTGRAVSEGNGVVLPDTIQTSAAINPGNSGGALVDLSGQVIGIPTLAAASGPTGAEAAGIGFAIPANTVKLIAPQLIEKGKVTSAGRAALGIAGQGVTSQDGTPIGVYVASVTRGGPAAKAGIAVGSIIEAIAGRPTPDFTELATVLATLSPGAKVPVKLLLPSGGERTVTVTLGDLAAG